MIPRYEIMLERKGNHTITQLELEHDYIFGKDLNLVSSQHLVLESCSAELKALNSVGTCVISIELPPVKSEDDAHGGGSAVAAKHAPGLLNEEMVSIVFTFLSYE